MPYLNPPQSGAKPSSRFSTLNVFKLKPGSASGSLGVSLIYFLPEPRMRSPLSADAVPPPPPKDSTYASSLNPRPSTFYNKSLFSRSAASLSTSLSPESNSGPATPSTPYPSMPSAYFEFGKPPNSALGSANGRATAASPVPSASGGSLRSFGRGGADYLPSPSVDGSTDSSGSCPNASSNPNLGVYILNDANSSSYTLGQATTATTASVKPKKGVFKLANLARRNRSRKDLS
ncbi:hypothetical protein J3R82DRAFT_9124 [Butyriboletus roseoflavus]|nr:hypothetical protein J3R82DRAFT_9124 [Butyriboletus roseoflavus]